MEKFPTVFKGLGTLGGPYEIQLKFVCISASVHQKVPQELDRMESIGVISKVDTPTP